MPGMMSSKEIVGSIIRAIARAPPMSRTAWSFGRAHVSQSLFLSYSNRPFVYRGGTDSRYLPQEVATDARDVQGGKESAKLKLSRITSCGFEANTM
jgi:hypothetical protein